MCLYPVLIKYLLKDNLIERLANEVRQADKTSVVVLEAEQMITKSASEEYNRPLTPLHVPSSDEVNFFFFSFQTNTDGISVTSSNRIKRP